MPAVTDADRRKIRRLHGRGLGRNEIAKQAGFSPATITKVCAAAGLTFERTATAAAVQAHQVDLRARRAAIIARLYDRTEKVLDRLEATGYMYSIVLPGGGDEGARIVEHVDVDPPAADERALSGALQTYLTAAAKLEAVDADGGATEATSMLARLGEALGVRPPT